jgi:hypothetical protein
MAAGHPYPGTSRRFATTLPFFAHDRAISGGNTPAFKN